MRYISHRGNINGGDINLENSTNYILNAIDKSFEVEIDIWLFKSKLYLGHDEPKYEFDQKLLKYKNKLWFHAKNLDVLPLLKKYNFHFFWHQDDDITITSLGYWWTYPGKKIYKNSICVLPEISNYRSIDCAGVCSDHIESYKKNKSIK